MPWTLRLTLLTALVTATSAYCPSSAWDQFSDMCYWRSNYTLPWDDVRSVCQQEFSSYSNMVSIHDKDLNDFIATDLLEGREAWLGLHRASDSSSWIWTDGSSTDYINWHGGDPEWIGEGCATINYIVEGDWTGFNCTRDSFYFVCQIPA